MCPSLRRARIGFARACTVLIIGGGLACSGCTSFKDPDRLFPVAYEMDSIRAAQDQLVSLYGSAIGSFALDRAKLLRNEIITQRMYAVDVQYSGYELGLT